MNQGRLLNRKTTAFAAVLLVLTLLTAMLTGNGGNQNIPRLHVTIKTQEAADNVPSGIRGIDVSEYQGSINWAQVAQDNVNFAMIRASIGTKADKYFVHNATNAVANGIAIGAYHYAKLDSRSSMEKQADHFISQLKKVDNITYPVVVDVELHYGLSRNALTTLCVEFLDRLKAAGYTPMFYSYTNFFRDYLNTSMFGDYPLWVANYQAEPNLGQKMWQHTSYGSVKGISGRVDINIAYEDLGKGKGIRVNKAISDSIKQTLNERHNSGLPQDGLDMAAMKSAVVTALQSELNRQLGKDLAITGAMNDTTLYALEEVPFTYGETKGNITYLIQVMLFYNGLYTEQLTGAYDAHTRQALEKYQRNNDIAVSGTPCRETLWYLFR